jgi:uncharacterized repeat protein (TIGR03843 family)
VTSSGPSRGWPSRPPVADDLARALLRRGEPEMLGRMPWSSNATFLVSLSAPSGEMLAIYKPERGERPLWDFPTGSLARREAAAFAVSEALGWGIVPDTVLREGPIGFGMLQRFVEHDPDEHYFTLLEDHRDAFRRMATFDVVINNADRKGGHCLLDANGVVRGIDHGVSFHTRWKLRTVIWEFAGEPIARSDVEALERLCAALDDGLAETLRALLGAEEVRAVRRRVQHLLVAGVLPAADPGAHAYPWPLV